MQRGARGHPHPAGVRLLGRPLDEEDVEGRDARLGGGQVQLSPERREVRSRVSLYLGVVPPNEEVRQEKANTAGLNELAAVTVAALATGTPKALPTA